MENKKSTTRYMKIEKTTRSAMVYVGRGEMLPRADKPANETMNCD